MKDSHITITSQDYALMLDLSTGYWQDTGQVSEGQSRYWLLHRTGPQCWTVGRDSVCLIMGLCCLILNSLKLPRCQGN